MKKILLIGLILLALSCQDYRQFPEDCKHEKKLVQYESGTYLQCQKCKRHFSLNRSK